MIAVVVAIEGDGGRDDEVARNANNNENGETTLLGLYPGRQKTPNPQKLRSKEPRRIRCRVQTLLGWHRFHSLQKRT